ncbi:MAG: HAD hydrolase-like protein [Tatlockia sp.]|nr:HAD hydrolase-like protein [Tatlockia sp.]
MLKTKSCNLIFDFDGTLVDSFNTIMQTFNLLAEEFNFRKLKENEIDGLKNLTSKELIRYLHIPIVKLPKVMRQAREYLRNEMPLLPAFIDLPEVLAELHHLGCSLTIVTSNSSENVTLWLERYNISHLFNFIHSESSYFGKKHSLKKLIKSQKMNTLQTYYIGDETRDVEAAQKCNINSIAVSWGFNSLKVLSCSNPDYIANKPKDLLTIIKERK